MLLPSMSARWSCIKWEDAVPTMAAVVVRLMNFGFVFVFRVVVGGLVPRAEVANRGSVAVSVWAERAGALLHLVENNIEVVRNPRVGRPIGLAPPEEGGARGRVSEAVGLPYYDGALC